MSWLTLIPGNYRWLAGASLTLALLIGVAGMGWLVQGWRLGERLAEQGRAFEQQIAARDKQRAEIQAKAQLDAAAEVRYAQQKRLKLEQQLQALSQTQYRKLTDAETTAARLRDRLATAELRLSVLIASGGAGRSADATVPASAGSRRLVDGAGRADIDSGSAQRIVAIVERGDRAIIALGMCQAYARTINLDG